MSVSANTTKKAVSRLRSRLPRGVDKGGQAETASLVPTPVVLETDESVKPELSRRCDVQVVEKEKMQFVCKLTDEMPLFSSEYVHTGDEIVDKCKQYLETQLAGFKQDESWKAAIVSTMIQEIGDAKFREQVRIRFLALQAHSTTHPDWDHLLTKLSKRVLFGELSGVSNSCSLAEFSKSLAQVYAGEAHPKQLWSRQWEKFTERWRFDSATVQFKG